MSLRRSLLLLSLVAAPLANAADTRSVRIPHGRSVLVNGFIGDGEWNDARQFDAGYEYRLLLKHDRRFLYVAIVFPDELHHTGGELYIADGSDVPASYHISGALGRREWREGAWTSYEWQPRSWSANAIQSIVDEGKTKFLAPECFEYQIEKRNFVGRQLRLRVELRRPVRVIPEKAGETDTDAWLHIRF